MRRGSATISGTPRCLTAWRSCMPNTGCCSVVFEPMMKRHLALSAMSSNVLVMAPEPNDVPRPETVGLCHNRAQWSMLCVSISWRVSLAARKFSSLVHRAEHRAAKASPP